MFMFPHCTGYKLTCIMFFVFFSAHPNTSSSLPSSFPAASSSSSLSSQDTTQGHSTHQSQGHSTHQSQGHPAVQGSQQSSPQLSVSTTGQQQPELFSADSMSPPLSSAAPSPHPTPASLRGSTPRHLPSIQGRAGGLVRDLFPGPGGDADSVTAPTSSDHSNHETDQDGENLAAEMRESGNTADATQGSGSPVDPPTMGDQSSNQHPETSHVTAEVPTSSQQLSDSTSLSHQPNSSTANISRLPTLPSSVDPSTLPPPHTVPHTPPQTSTTSSSANTSHTPLTSTSTTTSQIDTSLELACDTSKPHGERMDKQQDSGPSASAGSVGGSLHVDTDLRGRSVDGEDDDDDDDSPSLCHKDGNVNGFDDEDDDSNDVSSCDNLWWIFLMYKF